MDAGLPEENLQALMLVQALLGNVTGAFRAVSLECVGDEAVRVHVVLERRGPPEDEALQDLAFELEALQPGARPEVQLVTYVHAGPLGDLLRTHGRRVFLRWEPET